jgi:hypothetical protein
MGVSRFQPVKDEDQQYATKRDPAPERARFELSPMNDTHSPCLATKPEYSTRSIQPQPKILRRQSQSRW